ncbi:MAG TPA: 3-hydroxyacyl-CoA dehydrogenase family protein [Pyrinomonadaceae bacterium]|jgi:3-hydroxybutyryl-CoA dehydrogenase|nr:3-hydroxyacyl-CoA dehydrogenase family protein [Pyrinomonadaceae bacterium]
MSVQRVGVVGAGVMGVGVAQNLAQTKHQVVLLDVSEQVLSRAKQTIKKNLRLQSFFKKDKQHEAPDVVLDRIQFTVDYDDFADADFVIENAPERWKLKQGVYAQLDQVCPEQCVFAANTSAIPIALIASATKRAPQVLGMHFMNPVPMKPVVEVIRGSQTSPQTMNIAQELLANMGKEGVVVNDSPGFVSNRVLMLAINEAICLVHEQVATAADVDKIFTTCFGHAMGPLETADLIGLDTILLSIEVLYENFKDDKYRPCPLLEQMVAAGLHGRKSGQGFYNYSLPAV